MHITEKKVKGRPYLYLATNEKQPDGRWKKRTVAYLGKTPRQAIAKLATLDELAPAKRQKLITSLDGDQWESPEAVLEAVRQVFGGPIELDPTSKASNPTRALTYYTKDTDCLQQRWHGATYMNPPYSKPAPFLQKLIVEYQAGHISQAIALCKAGVIQNKSTAAAIHTSKTALCLWEGRLNFKHSRRKAKGNSNNFDVVAIYWGKDGDRFRDAFSQFGFCS